MARLEGEEREKRNAKILADFHAGKSQNALAKIYSCSPATINKICKGVEPKHVSTVNTLTSIELALSDESEYEVNAIRNEVEQRTKHIRFFNLCALKNVKEAMEKPCDGQLDFKHRAETIAKGRETVVGRTPDVAVQVNNSSSTIEMSREELLKIARGENG